MIRTRFAPSPTGPLHLGHAYSAMVGHDFAQTGGGVFLLRIDDIDQTRARPAWEAQIYDDLAWLGLTWEVPVYRQSDHIPDYLRVLEHLALRGLTYPCRCSRRDIRAAASAPQAGEPVYGPDGLIYPGTCRARPMSDAAPGDAIRLNMARALVEVASDLPSFTETGPEHAGTHRLTTDRLLMQIGDVVLARPGLPASYHLSVVIDDAAQRISHVVRGSDLFDASFLHVFLGVLLGVPIPEFHHHRLIVDDTGKRLAKRDDARALAKFRAEGATPSDIRRWVGLG